MKKVLLSFLGFMIVFTSCINESVIDNSFQESKNYEISLSKDECVALSINQDGPLITEEETLERACAIFDGSITRTNDLNCQVHWIKLQNENGLTRTANIDCLDSIPLYLVNKSDGKSLLLSGDKRIPEILAFADTPLSLDETNTGADIFSETLPIYINRKVDDFNARFDSLLNSAERKIEKENISIMTRNDDLPIHFSRLETSCSSWEDIYLYYPLLNVSWGQGYPYNLLTPFIECSGSMVHPPLGCATIATAQILSFYKYPTVFDGVNVNWIEMTAYPSIYSLSPIYQTQLQTMLNAVALGVSIEWGCGGSGTTILEVEKYLNKVGYVSELITNYDKTKVINSISNSRPIYMRGTQKDTIGHAWVIDGANKKMRTITQSVFRYKYPGVPPSFTLPSDWDLVDETTTTETEEYVHCNFGYEGMYDGYYIHGVFQLHDDTYGNGGLYNSKFMLLTNIKRR